MLPFRLALFVCASIPIETEQNQGRLKLVLGVGLGAGPPNGLLGGLAPSGAEPPSGSRCQ
eukprot:3666077-Prymnesium_polylepis.2